MGWKTLKQRYGIKGSIERRGELLYIGTPSHYNLASVSLLTGEVVANAIFPNFVVDNYPMLAQASAAEVKLCLDEPDQFGESTTFYTYKADRIIERQVERDDDSGLTHDGSVVYFNTYSTDRAAVLAWALDAARARVMTASGRLQDLQANIVAMEELRDRWRARVVPLESRATAEQAVSEYLDELQFEVERTESSLAKWQGVVSSLERQ